MNNIYLIIVGMAIVTYLPRMLPMVFIKEIKLPAFLKRTLNFIPYTALSALIFPEILYSTSNLESAILGALIAILLAWFKINLFIIVISSISGVLIYIFFI